MSDNSRKNMGEVMKREAMPAQTNDSSVLSMIERLATDPNVKFETIEKMVDMQERIFNKNAEIAFNKAMASCQAEMPSVVRDAVNNQTNSKYAKYETIIKTARPCYTKHGFALSFYQEESAIEGKIRVACDVMHSDGHTKKVFVDMALDQSGIAGKVNKTEVHATGSSFSYAKRYLFCLIFNVAVADEDDDGVKGGGITIEHLMEHNALVRDLFDSVVAIKVGIANEDWESAAMAWVDLDESEKSSLWRAPSKGGIFTTEERRQMHEGPFQDACKALAINRHQ